MIPVPEDTFLVDVSAGPDSVLGIILEKFRAEETGTQKGKVVFYDTFDWRLYRKKLLLVAVRNELVLRAFDGSEICRLAFRKTRRMFWWDLGETELSSVLRKQISMRALCPALSLNYMFRSFKIMNRDRKTVSRFTVKSNTATKGEAEMELPEQLHVQGVRGYEKAYQKVIKSLPGQVLKPIDQYIDLIDEAYGISERQPLDYGAKFSVELEDGISTGQAVSKICLSQVEAMEINRPGVMDDIDSEFLHDFRIAVRRTRSLLSLLRKVLPKKKISEFESEFKWLGTITGPLRDIDVYLLKKDQYLGLLPDSLSEGLMLFFEELQQRRDTELGLLSANLSSHRYSDLVESWQEFNTDPESELFLGVRKQECRPLVSSIIKKRFRSFLKEGDAICDDTPDEQLHRLRIKGKKFRYLLEFFRSFYDVSQVDLFLKHIKKLQDNLGDFNDLSVQVELLELKLQGLTARNKQTVRLAAALGSLITRLVEEHLKTRNKFNKTYSSFCTPENKALITEMTRGCTDDRAGKRKV